MLQTNKILTRIELAGNNIPADILKAIGKLVTTEPLYNTVLDTVNSEIFT